jgi:hypothetical protein
MPDVATQVRNFRFANDEQRRAAVHPVLSRVVRSSHADIGITARNDQEKPCCDGPRRPHSPSDAEVRVDLGGSGKILPNRAT